MGKEFVFIVLLDTWINSCRGHKSCSREQSIPVHISGAGQRRRQIFGGLGKKKPGLKKQTENLTLYTNPVLDTLDSRGHKSCSRENQHENKITDGVTSVSADH